VGFFFNSFFFTILIGVGFFNYQFTATLFIYFFFGVCVWGGGGGGFKKGNFFFGWGLI